LTRWSWRGHPGGHNTLDDLCARYGRKAMSKPALCATSVADEG
jgi:hypothetical protein